MKHVDKFGDGFETWPYYDVPEEWIPVVDEALDRIFEIAPEAIIHQIKIKFGGLRLYVNANADTQEQFDEVHKIISETESKCFNASYRY